VIPATHVERSWHGHIQRGRSEAGDVRAVTFGIHAIGIRLEIGHRVGSVWVANRYVLKRLVQRAGHERPRTVAKASRWHE
jgi:hypothetical protein